jgi:uncharacterized membrane protein HdeD (DUF308 family)
METKNQQVSAEAGIVELEELPRKWKLMLALGILMVVAGTMGLYVAVAVTLVTVLLYGGMLVAGGILSLVHFFKVKEKKWHGRMTDLLLALLYTGLGVVIFINPVAASAALTLVLGAFFMFIGVLRIRHGVRCRKQGWKWLLPVAVGLVDCVFALIIALSWPVSGLWVIGLFVSFELIMNGWILTLTALAVRKLGRMTTE